MFTFVRRVACAAALFALFFSGAICCTTAPPHELRVSDSAVYGGTSDLREDVRNAIAFLEPVVQDAVQSVHITDDCPEYKPKDDDGNWREGGHCHWTRDICIRPSHVLDEAVWHECAHACFMSHAVHEQLQWATVSPAGVYGNYEGREDEFPRDGILTAYGATNTHEDFAEWVRWAMCYLYHTPTGRTFVNLRRVNAADPSYAQKLRLLRDWGIITPTQYAQLEPLFTLRVDGEPLR